MGRLLHDDQKESGLLPTVARLIKTFAARFQPKSHAGNLVRTMHLILRLLERLSSQGPPGILRAVQLYSPLMPNTGGDAGQQGVLDYLACIPWVTCSTLHVGGGLEWVQYSFLWWQAWRTSLMWSSQVTTSA